MKSEHESRINSALGMILSNYNYLEYNLGLSIRLVENPEKVERSHKWLARSSLQEKIDRFASIVRESEVFTDAQELDNWVQAATNIRSLRNFYVHGSWYPLLDGNLVFHIPPWRQESINGVSQRTMSLGELEADAIRVKEVFEQFSKLRRKYGI